VTEKIIRNSLVFFLVVLLQVLIVKNMNLGVYFILFPYVLFIVVMPFETPRLLVLLLSFLGGVSLDIFYNSPGLHAAACTAMGFTRHYVLQYISPREGYDPAFEPCAEDMGHQWFTSYSFVLILVHHVFFFVLEVFRLEEFFSVLIRILFSGIGTFSFVYLLQYFVFYRRLKK